jgi:hypothetical protein
MDAVQHVVGKQRATYRKAVLTRTPLALQEGSTDQDPPGTTGRQY